ncbi:LysR family transcriptional regulator [Marinactinospora rubrisoli]|uniref:LysR family transcriptional regulator n=1 Tax=Marinactinospora rubrisoli TaxID=2715399 RepID=A0ABW2KA18_9ACTN
MDLRQMEYLVTLAAEQQFTRAAAICGVSQSGLSAAIRGLERELGTRLFHRTTRKVEPTDAGHALLPHARTMLAQAAAAREAVEHTSRRLLGRLRVGAEQCLGVVDVNALLERVRRRHPLLDLHFTQAGSHELTLRVREGVLDVAFIATADRLGTLERIELGRQPLVLLAPPGHPLNVERAVEWAELEGQDFIDFHESWAIRTLNDAAGEAHGVARRVRCTVNDVHTLLDLTHRGLGAAIVPRHVAAKPQAAGLTIRSMPPDAPGWTVSAITSAAATASTRRVIDLIRTPDAA